MTTQGHKAQDDSIAAQNLIADQREANTRMVSVTIRAQELAELATAAQARAEAITKQLQESEERYRTLFELSPTAVYSCDGAGVIQKFNQRAVQLWGREPTVGHPAEKFCGSFKLFRPDGSFMPHEQCPMADVVSGRISEVHDAEVRVERADGSRVTCIVNIRPLKNQRGEVVGAINCFYDISDRKRAETELSDSLNRERELAEFRERFIGILGHDMRTPLGSIVMAAGVLIERGHLEYQDSLTTARIIRSSERMTRMIGQLLDLTRARLGGGLPIERKPTDLREVCQDVIEEFDATIQLDIDGDVIGVWDPDRLAEALSNITRNAIEHAMAGTVVIAKARATEAEVLVEIINQGEPIPAALHPFIFEPFRRARQGEKSVTGNLGLGLYIAHQIVLSHGGTLDAHSADGTTTFAMRLPRRPLLDETRITTPI